MLSIATYFFGTLILQDGEIEIPQYHPRRLLLRSEQKPEIPGVRVLRWMPQIKYAVLECAPGEREAVRARLIQQFGPRSVERDRAARPAYTPNDPNVGSMWHLTNMRVPQAWDRSLGSNIPIVAIMDTGVNHAHEDLAANIWQNPNEIVGNGLDDDSNGYVDDTIGWDFVAGDNVPNDVHGHGTACAGIAAAVGDNGIGVTGIAPKARIMCLKAAQDDGYFFLSNNLPAYLYAADNGARVLSMSFYSDSLSPAEREAIDYLVSKGCLPIAAAGNDSTVYPYYPGAYENTLAVAATVQSNAKASFSDWGSWVDVAAPGVGIWTTVTGGGYTSGFAGTSAACPNAAGVAALLFGAKPDATVAEVRAAMEDSALLLDQPPFGEFSNYGLLQADAALAALLDGPAPRKPSKIRYVTPVGTSTSGTALAQIYGRTLDRHLTVTGTLSRRSRTTFGRDYANYRLGPDTGSLNLGIGFGTVATATSPVASGLVYPLIEGGSDSGGLVYGGYWDTLRQADRTHMRVTRRSDGSILLEGTFRKLPSTGPTYLALRRRYSGVPVGVERIQLYDWASASYPYGSWITLRSGSLPTAWTFFDAAIPNGANVVDYEGTVYFRILTDANQPAETELQLDMAYIR